MLGVSLRARWDATLVISNLKCGENFSIIHILYFNMVFSIVVRLRPTNGRLATQGRAQVNMALSRESSICFKIDSMSRFEIVTD